MNSCIKLCIQMQSWKEHCQDRMAQEQLWRIKKLNGWDCAFFNLKASLSVGEAQHVIKCVKVEQRAKKGGIDKTDKIKK